MVMGTEQQYSTCLYANGQLCKVDALFYIFTNPLTCKKALYAKNNQEIGAQCSLSIFHTPPALSPTVIMLNLWIFISTPATQVSAITLTYPDKVACSSPFQQPLNILKLSPACCATSRHFHLPPHYEDHTSTIHVSLDKANLNAVNVSTQDFHIWQHFGSNWTMAHIQKFADVPEIPVAQLYRYMIGQSEPILHFQKWIMLYNSTMSMRPSSIVKTSVTRPINQIFQLHSCWI